MRTYVIRNTRSSGLDRHTVVINAEDIDQAVRSAALTEPELVPHESWKYAGAPHIELLVTDCFDGNSYVVEARWVTDGPVRSLDLTNLPTT